MTKGYQPYTQKDNNLYCVGLITLSFIKATMILLLSDVMPPPQWSSVPGRNRIVEWRTSDNDG